MTINKTSKCQKIRNSEKSSRIVKVVSGTVIVFYSPINCGQWNWTKSRLVRDKLLYKPLVLGIGNAKFWPPTTRKPFNRFWWNLKLRTISRSLSDMQDHKSLRRRGWPGWTTQFVTVSLCPCLSSFFWFLHIAHRSRRWTDLYQNWHVSAVPAEDVPFEGLVFVGVL